MYKRQPVVVDGCFQNESVELHLGHSLHQNSGRQTAHLSNLGVSACLSLPLLAQQSYTLRANAYISPLHSVSSLATMTFIIEVTQRGLFDRDT